MFLSAISIWQLYAFKKSMPRSIEIGEDSTTMQGKISGLFYEPILAGTKGMVPRILTFPAAPLTISASFSFLSTNLSNPNFLTVVCSINELLQPVSTMALTLVPRIKISILGISTMLFVFARSSVHYNVVKFSF